MRKGVAKNGREEYLTPELLTPILPTPLSLSRNSFLEDYFRDIRPRKTVERILNLYSARECGLSYV